jgi:hypothetical protein
LRWRLDKMLRVNKLDETSLFCIEYLFAGAPWRVATVR